MVIIDEAQRISDIGLKLKLIVDEMPNIQLIATGSSSLNLANKLGEPLTGRKWEYKMFPLTFGEMVAHHGLLEEKRLLPHRLIFGYYPDIVAHPDDKIELLKQQANDYLFKDILMLDGIKKSDRLVKLVQVLAFQIGQEVSYNELGQLCGLDSKTIEKYITLLEQSYVVFRLGSFSRNLRNELKLSKKIYFYDNGIRNAVISNFAEIENRNDTGALFENFAISERIKSISYKRQVCESWFWRTKSQQEVDYVEESNGEINAYEFKFSPKRKATLPGSFATAYPDAKFSMISADNIEDFIL
jgi:predicted AAA+ superfamily ATPase